jgi:hypothetical protein
MPKQALEIYRNRAGDASLISRGFPILVAMKLSGD